MKQGSKVNSNMGTNVGWQLKQQTHNDNNQLQKAGVNTNQKPQVRLTEAKIAEKKRLELYVSVVMIGGLANIGARIAHYKC